MTRGEFCSSSRVATFITTLSDFNIELQYTAGVYNLPSDFHFRNPVACDSSICQVCQFVFDNTSSAVHFITIENVFNGEKKISYTNCLTWKSLQMKCHDLQRAHSHLTQGTRPSTKNSKSTKVKRYLQCITVRYDGLMVKKYVTPFLPEKELIVIPQNVLNGILTSFHVSII